MKHNIDQRHPEGGAYWEYRCSACKITVDLNDPRWRWGHDGWEHKCQGDDERYFLCERIDEA